MNDDDGDSLSILEALCIVGVALATAVGVWLFVCLVFYFI